MRTDLPSGTVTFLFTDVEGSTKLLQGLGEEAYGAALARHRSVIREACTAQGGVEVDTQGDAFFFAFPTAPGALAAAEALTERLAEGPVRVRVGLHTGTPILGEEGYVGHDVHRAARIAAAGHGGQVLVSAPTASLVNRKLIDLGEHRFKDLEAPERVFQIGEGAFPALRSLYATTLPVPATPFLGRERELAEVVSLLTRVDARLVTLTGPGGTGKTRLALQAAADASDNFPDGVYWVPLAPLRDPLLLEATVAQVLEVSEQPGVAISDSIVASFASRRSLIVVDNCEHLADAVATLLRQLLEGCPFLVISASSRERLGLRAERVHAVSPMGAADGGLLFVERALAVASDFAPDEHVPAICEAVDGLPLAIELAAARVRSLSTQAILERVGERLAFLATRDREADERQRTLEATIAWSYDLLDPEEQRVLRALSVFAGGCTLEAAEEVARAGLDLLESLLDKSLLQHRIDDAGQDRYWMLETIREYMAARLEDAAEADEREKAHRAFLVLLAEELGGVPGRPATAAQFARFRADRDNFRLALLRSIEAGDAGSASRFVRFLGSFWYMWHEFAESYAVVRRALALDGGEADDRAYALCYAATFASELGELAEARAMLVEAEALFASSGELAGLAEVASCSAFLESSLGNASEAVAQGERALGLALEAGDESFALKARVSLATALGVAAFETEPPDTARLERALEVWTAGLEELRSFGIPPEGEANNVIGIAVFLTLLGRYSEALARAQEALRLRRSLGMFDADAVLTAGYAASGLARDRQAVALVTWALHTFDEQGVGVSKIDRRLFDRLEADARATLGDDGYEAAVGEGEAMTHDQAVELALSLMADA